MMPIVLKSASYTVSADDETRTLGNDDTLLVLDLPGSEDFVKFSNLAANCEFLEPGTRRRENVQLCHRVARASGGRSVPS